jgi:cytochrome P450
MLALDDARHQRLRSIVGTAFTLKVLALAEQSIRDRARDLVTAMVNKHSDGEGELVADLAGPLPLQVICDMMGIPEEDEQQIFHWTNLLFGFGDPELAPDLKTYVDVVRNMGAYGRELAESRRRSPGDDLTTSLVEAEVDGERLTASEIASFFNLLMSAGIETTRNAISLGYVFYSLGAPGLLNPSDQERHSRTTRVTADQRARFPVPGTTPDFECCLRVT